MCYIKKSRTNKAEIAQQCRECEGVRGGGGGGAGGETAKLLPSRQSSSYIPIRGWHSLISHIITLVRSDVTIPSRLRLEGDAGIDERRWWLAFPLRAAFGGQIYDHLGYWFTGRRHCQEVAPVRMDQRHPECAWVRNNPERHHMFVLSRAVSRVVMTCLPRSEFRACDYYFMSNERVETVSLDLLGISQMRAIITRRDVDTTLKRERQLIRYSGNYICNTIEW